MQEGDIPMTAGQSMRRLANGSHATAPLTALLAATLFGGAMIGAGVSQYLAATDAGTATIGLEAQPAATFDAPAFRAEERRPLVRNADSGALSLERRDPVGGP
jgi:hypothetical protein